MMSIVTAEFSELECVTVINTGQNSNNYFSVVTLSNVSVTKYSKSQ